MDDELRVIRDRHNAIQDDIDRLPSGDPGGSRGLLCVTTTIATYPTTASVFYAVISQDIDGAETEGASASFTSPTGTPFFAWNAGSAIPPSGTQVIVSFVGGKAAFRYDG